VASLLKRDGFQAFVGDALWPARKPPVEAIIQSIRATETFLSEITVPLDYPQVHEIRGWLSALHLYHDLRTDPASELRRATVARLERQVDPDGSNLIAVLHTLYSSEIGFREDVNAAMRAAFGEDFDELIFPPAEDGRVQMRLRWKSLNRPQSTADLSDGILRFLFLTTVLASPTPPPLIAIDEPETGLHPSMLPLVAELAAEASKRTQVILTTHSPQLLNAFSEYPEITTVAEWRAGKTVLRRLPADKLAKWLEHYQLGELMLSGELETME
ncbi:MAG: AAA family ATPase, partial [Chloroflexi bacterium]|nr:AAA family ATPase [Chloroflexota bacterium]